MLGGRLEGGAKENIQPGQVVPGAGFGNLGDGLVQGCFDFRHQPMGMICRRARFAGQNFGGLLGVQPRAIECFGDIDITEAGDIALIEQEGFQIGFAAVGEVS